MLQSEKQSRHNCGYTGWQRNAHPCNKQNINAHVFQMFIDPICVSTYTTADDMPNWWWWSGSFPVTEYRVRMAKSSSEWPMSWTFFFTYLVIISKVSNACETFLTARYLKWSFFSHFYCKSVNNALSPWMHMACHFKGHIRHLGGMCFVTFQRFKAVET